MAKIFLGVMCNDAADLFLMFMLIDCTDSAISNIVWNAKDKDLAFYLKWNDFEVKTSEYIWKYENGKIQIHIILIIFYKPR